MNSAKLISSDLYELLLKSLKNGVKPALGCTEPVAVGLAVAKAYEVLEGEVKRVEVRVSPNIYKNGMGVGIPGTKEIGLIFATALGITCGDPDLGLEVFKYVNDRAIAKAKDLVDADLIQVGLEDGEGNFFIQARVITDKGEGICKIRDSHTNIVYLEVDGEVVLDKELKEDKEDFSNDYMKDLSLTDLREFIEAVDYEDIEFLLDGVRMNMDMARAGLVEKAGAGLGAALDSLVEKKLLGEDLVNRARVMTAAACDARMAGLNLPVMSSAGSGNHGITAIVPAAVVCQSMGCDDEKLARALALSHLVTAYIKVYIGGLSPVCGCAVAAGIGASASITWALGGGDEQIQMAIKNMIANLTGMICDGAKGGCAFKLSTAAAEAVLQAQLALANVQVNDLDGILSPTAEEAIRNLGKVCTEGMEKMDNTILEVMVNR